MSENRPEEEIRDAIDRRDECALEKVISDNREWFNNIITDVS